MLEQNLSAANIDFDKFDMEGLSLSVRCRLTHGYISSHFDVLKRPELSTPRLLYLCNIIPKL